MLFVVWDFVVFDLCEGESVVYEGVIYDEINLFSLDIFFNYIVNGCDFIFEVICYFRLNFIYVVNEIFCLGEVIIINGIIYDES